MITGLLEDGGMIDRALAQTQRAGLRYAVAPLPSWYAWMLHITPLVESKFKWWETCGLPGYNFGHVDGDPVAPDEDGNIYWCLLPTDHEGDCARP